MDSKNGIIYVAFGDKYFKEAQVSLASLREFSNIPACLVSNSTLPDFDYHLKFEPIQNKLLNKPYALSQLYLPFERYLFLDTDTIILGDITPLFDLLDYCDLAAAACRDGMSNKLFGLPYYNTGVILANRYSNFMSLWYSCHKPEYKHNDQASFYDTVLIGNHKTFTLPNEFNLRLNSTTFVNGQVYIAHGRGKDISSINDYTGPRIWNKTNVERV